MTVAAVAAVAAAAAVGEACPNERIAVMTMEPTIEIDAYCAFYLMAMPSQASMTITPSNLVLLVVLVPTRSMHAVQRRLNWRL